MTRNAPATKSPNIQNGTYTIAHDERGHYTVKLHTAQKGGLAGKRILSLLVGPDNEGDYQGVAFWDDDAKCAHVWRRHRGAINLPIDGRHWTNDPKRISSVQAKLAIWSDLALRGDGTGGELTEDGRPRRGYWAQDGYTLLLDGRCVVCNRKLTDPESIRTGIGPKCGGRSA